MSIVKKEQIKIYGQFQNVSFYDLPRYCNCRLFVNPKIITTALSNFIIDKQRVRFLFRSSFTLESPVSWIPMQVIIYLERAVSWVPLYVILYLERAVSWVPVLVILYLKGTVCWDSVYIILYLDRAGTWVGHLIPGKSSQLGSCTRSLLQLEIHLFNQ